MDALGGEHPGRGIYQAFLHDDRVQDVVLDGVRVRVLSLEGLLKTKSGVRPKDQIDAAAITRALAELRK